MPPRTVTADLGSLVGVPVLQAAPVPYRDVGGTPAFLRNGRFLDVLVLLPPGTEDANSVNRDLYEALESAPDELRQADGSAIGEVWGQEKRSALLDPLDPGDAAVIAGERIAACVFDMGKNTGIRVDDARGMPVVDGVRGWEILINARGNNGNSPLQYIYDTLDVHPSGLRAVAEQSAWVRRNKLDDPPPGWTERESG